MAAAGLRQVIIERGIRGATEAAVIPKTTAYFGFGGYDKIINRDIEPIEVDEEGLMNHVSNGIIRDVKELCGKSKAVQPKLIEYCFFDKAVKSFRLLPERVQMLGWDDALNDIQNYPQADGFEVFRVRMEIRKKMRKYSDLSAEEGITKYDVICRVLGVMKYYPKLDWSKLHNHSLYMNEGHFSKDLGLNEQEWAIIQWGIKEEFMLELIPNKIESCKLLVEYIYENIRPHSYEGNPTPDQVFSLASLVIKVVDHYINNMSSDSNNNTHRVILCETLCLIENLIPFKRYPISAKLSLISIVLDHFQKHPKINGRMVYYLRMHIRSMLEDKGQDDIAKVQIISRTLTILQDYSVVKDESKFYKELGLNEEEWMAEMNGLEFEPCTPDIYDKRMSEINSAVVFRAIFVGGLTAFAKISAIIAAAT